MNDPHLNDQGFRECLVRHLGAVERHHAHQRIYARRIIMLGVIGASAVAVVAAALFERVFGWPW